jgi:hypothetical protein
MMIRLANTKGTQMLGGSTGSLSHPVFIVNESEKPSMKTHADSLFHRFKSNLQVCFSMFVSRSAAERSRGAHKSCDMPLVYLH